MKKVTETAKTYSFLWNKERTGGRRPDSHHCDKMQGVVPFSIVSGKLGVEGGCGNGYDLRIAALRYPDTDFIGIDISDGIYNAKKNCEGLANIRFVKASLTDLPFKQGIFNFAYSYGVIHHTPAPERCFEEFGRILDVGSRLTVYLYEKHEDNPLKRYLLIPVTFIRLITSRLPKKLLYVLCLLSAPLIFLVFSVPARALSIFKATKWISDKIPFNFATGPFSLTGDLYDRFGAPIEYRYNKEEMKDFFNKASFKDINVTKLKDIAGWVAWGTKKE